MSLRFSIIKLFSRKSLKKLTGLNRRIRGSRRPRLEWLEDRTLLSMFTVTNTRDDGSTGSLRSVLDHARSVFQLLYVYGERGPFTIDFDPVVFAGHQTITLNGHELYVQAPVTIAGPSGGVTVDANGGSRAFEVDNYNTSFINITIANGNANNLINYGGGGFSTGG